MKYDSKIVKYPVYAILISVPPSFFTGVIESLHGSNDPLLIPLNLFSTLFWLVGFLGLLIYTSALVITAKNGNLWKFLWLYFLVIYPINTLYKDYSGGYGNVVILFFLALYYLAPFGNKCRVAENEKKKTMEATE